jgi:hypothetical protein
MCKILRAVESPLLGYNDLQGGFEELQGIVAQGQERNRGFSREKFRGVSGLPCPYKVSLSSPEPLISLVTTQQ